MLFNSGQFLWFFPLVTCAYFALPHRARWALLLAASVWFYMAFVPVYVLILAFTIVVDYAAGLLIEGSAGRVRRAWLLLSIAANVGVLAVFKYWNFLADNVNGLAGAFHLPSDVPLLRLLLPIGLSFHTFQAMSYTIEVYRGRQPAERHFGIYALYVMFYPQLVAGPIERPQNLLHQFRDVHRFDADRVFAGLSRMLTGMFKKVVIADRLAIIVDQVYAQPASYDAAALLCATWFFAVQIYCDFSGYSDIALGAAQVMGFRLMENFNRPYFARSIADFWRRWHISLSTWFRDYVYVPLGGNRVGAWRRCANLLIVFLVSGLWHGAAWTFVLWGALHGAYLVAAIFTARIRGRLTARIASTGWLRPLIAPMQVFITFNLVAFAWIFFRANNFDDAAIIVSRLGAGALYALGNLTSLPVLDFRIAPFPRRDLAWAALLILVLVVVQLYRRDRLVVALLERKPLWVRWGLYYAMLLLIAVAGVLGEQSFIYFQF